MKQPINLLLADDSQIYLEGLKSILRENENQINVIGEACNKREAIRFLNTNPPDIIVLDIQLEEDMDGIELACEVNKNFPGVKVIIMSHYKDIEHIINALKAHVHAYLAKDATPEEVNNTINSVYKGKGLYLGETLSKQTIEKLITVYYGTEQNLRKSKPHDLSEREIEVIGYMAKGFSSKEIAKSLFIGTTTVVTHKENIKRKLNCNTAIEIIVFAIAKKIIIVE